MATFVGFAVLVTALIHLYLWKRLVRDTTRPGRWRKAGGVAALLLALLVPATMVGTRNGSYWLAWPGYLWLALMFYLLVLLLVLEVPMAVAKLVLRRRERAATGAAAEPSTVPAGGSGAAATSPIALAEPPAAAADAPPNGGPAGDRPDHDPSRRLLLTRGAAIFAGLTAAGVTGYGVRTAMGPPRLDRVRIPLAKLPRAMDGLRIATVSDIHLGPLRGRSHTERIVAMINRLDADLVAVVGDLVDGSVAELGPAAEPLRDLRSRYGSFFVTGNHEYYSGVEEWVREVDRLGLRVLQNERQEIRARRGVLDLAGVNDVTAAGTGLAAPADYAAALGDRDPARPVVLLAHQPVAAHEAAKFGVDLQLSGHTHGGQMVPFNLLVKLQQPVVSGLGEVDGTKVYVTNGAGFWGPPVRVGAPPQVTLVELRAP
ncbi:metallophosphoesterase [Micromonospora terminaliae]|uniref:Metallophosphoesterase n=1 Tax=Micromonospora terminaliae TaxID=1914461 RepID=A0AAJ2ZHK8_9ACTN|nr:metallophosphoesterase [Micromonospora terminaliae]NES29771.1 metallophosphoesterase [Micromonospora terminaliae]QGL50041.1 metallophosphoesterase [Micromonospora terminaliae]